MNAHTWTSTSLPMVANPSTPWLGLAEDPAAVIRGATCEQSRHLSSASSSHTESSAPAAHPHDVLAGSNKDREGEQRWSYAVVLVGLLTLLGASSMLYGPQAQPTVDAAPLTRVLDLTQ